ncbi:MauE/DoxX family redox-associated membrane protein [Sphingobium sp. OAS761]|uniref:MauE/DoxX family redox-associated membrane protein n=1 Tax=Sphingobium sp. OAS761 TaxID=2817901 RepID=UPI0020A08342|nr:MauE/DoxX family redox-associated membrane protein [Sphingobium sp. OAS761]
MPALLAVAGRTATIGIGIVFLAAATAQWRHRAMMPGIIANYRLLPVAMVPVAALLLPLAELLTGAALAAGLRPFAPIAGIALLLLFAAAMAINIRRGRDHIDCGCGHGALAHPIGAGLVVRNMVLAALLAPALAPAPALGATDLLTATAGGIAIALLVWLSQSIVALATSPLHRR